VYVDVCLVGAAEAPYLATTLPGTIFPYWRGKWRFGGRVILETGIFASKLGGRNRRSDLILSQGLGAGLREDAMARRGITATSLVSGGFSAAMTVAATLAVVVPGIAHAQMVECEFRILQPNDERRLVASAKSSLPPGLETFVTHPCRNGSTARAGIVTEHVKESNGVLHWWELICRRDAEDWKCDPAAFKQFISTTLLLRGRSRQVAISFGKDTTLSQARQFSTQAITLYADPASKVPSCSTDVIESRWAVIRAREKLPGPKKPIHVEVGVETDANSVMLSDINVEIRLLRSNVGASNLTTACFNEFVVVT
jgi:hypothetical protein